MVTRKRQEATGMMGMYQDRLIGLCNLSLGLIALIVLTACGGGGSGGSIAPNVSNPTYTAGTYAPSSSYAGHCAAPRSGTPDVPGSVTWENFWLRSWTHELYLWYGEVPDLNPASYSTSAAYFDLMKTTQAKDRFHFTYNTADWIALSQSGVSAGYGVTWVMVSSTVPRNVVVAYTEPNSPASIAPTNLIRGEKVVLVDGVSINDSTQAGIATLNAGLFPTNVNQSHTFVMQALNGSTRSISMTSATITETPVLNYAAPGIIANNGSSVGYLIFNDHFATAESELITAINTLKQAGVTDLVLDLRYNGGGYLDIASELAYMIAGSARTNGRIFERIQFNTQYSSNVNPVTHATNTPTPFYSTAVGFSATTGTPLPSLNLDRVFILTGTGTCSASESIINGLTGIGVQVIQIGSTTCGKPYGFYPQDNCGTTYFSIEFQGVNDVGFGSYGDGFTPNNASNSITSRLPGCSVADDFTHSLGDTTEGRLAAALNYRVTSSCGPATGSSGRPQIQSVTADTNEVFDGTLNKGAWRENRILSH